jgi:hypothetical protein
MQNGKSTAGINRNPKAERFPTDRKTQQMKNLIRWVFQSVGQSTGFRATPAFSSYECPGQKSLTNVNPAL